MATKKAACECMGDKIEGYTTRLHFGMQETLNLAWNYTYAYAIFIHKLKIEVIRFENVETANHLHVYFSSTCMMLKHKFDMNRGSRHVSTEGILHTGRLNVCTVSSRWRTRALISFTFFSTPPVTGFSETSSVICVILSHAFSGKGNYFKVNCFENIYSH